MDRMPRWMLIAVAVGALVYCATVLVAGTPEYVIPGAILFALVVGYAAFERILTRAHMRHHDGDPGHAMRDDEDWPVPAAHLIPDDVRPAGDTPEVHDEINPHDLPIDHPGRQAAEEQAAGRETSGNAQGAQGGRFTRERDGTTERTGEPQRSAQRAKSTIGPRGGGAGGDGKSSTPGQTP